ncbi:isopentenyl transferase family protein (plasmid) [Actinacidiphila glaucinigra]|uniref:isopentenyl transferase family protein n=1 Tax=Actinacidiphila glaucinigra TaxID=235986 RepID=UPI002DD8EB04|nr:isopentenyl transferase family protein [Actinacidiphila glaucinigra]WSD65890.1 isopentenyl transferase family protein [Actinacidiphila glaucinigra]
MTPVPGSACMGAEPAPGVILVLGPTGIGKTARSVELSRKYGSPVIALDRIQCHPQLAVGSGRPTPAETAGTIRIYLDERSLALGILDPGDAVDRLTGEIKRLRDAGATTLILEGGSISLLTELARRSDWTANATVRADVWLEASPRRYRDQVARRVEQMLGYCDHEPRTLLDEVADLVLDPAHLEPLHSIVGYREVLDISARRGMPPTRLQSSSGRMLRMDLFEGVLGAHLDYARQQRHALQQVLPALTDLGVRVEVRER